MSLPQIEKRPRPRMRFRERVIFRLALSTPIVFGIMFAPDKCLRYVVAVGFLLNFLSTEAILAKLRNL